MNNPILFILKAKLVASALPVSPPPSASFIVPSTLSKEPLGEDASIFVPSLLQEQVEQMRYALNRART